MTQATFSLKAVLGCPTCRGLRGDIRTCNCWIHILCSPLSKCSQHTGDTVYKQTNRHERISSFNINHNDGDNHKYSFQSAKNWQITAITKHQYKHIQWNNEIICIIDSCRSIAGIQRVVLKFSEIQKIGHRNYFMSTCDGFFVFKVNLDSRNCSSVANGLCERSEFGGGYGEWMGESHVRGGNASSRYDSIWLVMISCDWFMR